MTKATITKKKILIMAVLQFQRFSPLSSWHEAQQHHADMMLEELSGLYFHLKAARKRLEFHVGSSLSI